MDASTVGLVRTFAAVSLVTLLLAAALVWPRREPQPVRSTSFETDEPSGKQASPR
jgi:hypothetical protein